MLVGWLVGCSILQSPFAFLAFTDGFYITAPAQILGLAFFITAPAYPHATSVAMCPALFWCYSMIHLICNILWGHNSTSDAGSQYCCGWVGRGIQPPSTLRPCVWRFFPRFRFGFGIPQNLSSGLCRVYIGFINKVRKRLKKEMREKKGRKKMRETK